MSSISVQCDFTCCVKISHTKYTSQGNGDGQKETNWGALDARSVPWYVLPDKFYKANKDIKPNALGAIICDDKMYYGIFGDSK